MEWDSNLGQLFNSRANYPFNHSREFEITKGLNFSTDQSEPSWSLMRQGLNSGLRWPFWSYWLYWLSWQQLKLKRPFSWLTLSSENVNWFFFNFTEKRNWFESLFSFFNPFSTLSRLLARLGERERERKGEIERKRKSDRDGKCESARENDRE